MSFLNFFLWHASKRGRDDHDALFSSRFTSSSACVCVVERFFILVLFLFGRTLFFGEVLPALSLLSPVRTRFSSSR